MGKKRDDPNPEERELFQDAVADAERLHDDRTEPFRRRLKPIPLPVQERDRGDGFDDDFADLEVETGEELLFMRPGIQNRLFLDLRRGRLPPQDMLDLHGLRVIEARQALARFLAHAHRHRLRVVQIIHGKGAGSQTRQPVLKQKINQWLRQREEVLAFCSAPRFDGGTGAAYVLLSRKGEERRRRSR